MPTRPGFQPYGGTRLRLVRRLMKASTAISHADLLKRTAGANTLEPATSNAVFVAVYLDGDIASTDTDYASTKYRSVMLLTPDLQFYAPVEAGTATAATVGTTCDLNSADGIDVGTTTNGDFTVDIFLTASEVVGHFNGIDNTRA